MDLKGFTAPTLSRLASLRCEKAGFVRTPVPPPRLADPVRGATQSDRSPACVTASVQSVKQRDAATRTTGYELEAWRMLLTVAVPFTMEADSGHLCSAQPRLRESATVDRIVAHEV